MTYYQAYTRLLDSDNLALFLVRQLLPGVPGGYNYPLLMMQLRYMALENGYGQK